MSRRLVTAVAASAAVLAGLVCWGPPTAGQAPPAPVPAAAKWEYKVVKGMMTEEEMNAAGADGWELATMTAPQPGPLHSSFTTFKRPKR